MMFHKNQEHETAEGLDTGKCMAQYFSVLNLLHYTTLHFTTLHYTTLHYTILHYTTLHYTVVSSKSKRIFNTANNHCRTSRADMSPDTLERLVVVHSNVALLRDMGVRR